MQFETNFGVVALQFLEEDRQRENAPPAAAITPSGWIVVGSGPSSSVEGVTNAIPGSERKSSRGLRASFSTSHLSNFATNPPVVSGQHIAPALMTYSSSSGSSGSNELVSSIKDLRRSASQNSLSSSFQSNVYANVWKALLNLSVDPFVGVAEIAKKIVNGITLKATIAACPQRISSSASNLSTSAPSSPGKFSMPYHAGSDPGMSPPRHGSSNETPRSIKGDSTQAKAPTPGPLGAVFPHSYEFHTKRKMFDKGPEHNKQPSSASEDNDQDSDEDAGSSKPPMISTNFAEWCASYFAQSVMKVKLRYKCNRFANRQHS